MLEKPGHLGSREVRIEDETGASANHSEVRCEFVAALGRSTVLPHDRASERERSLRAPGDHGLALVRDADRGRSAGPLDDFTEGGDHRIPDLEGIVLDPAGFGEVLSEFAVGGDARSPVGEDRS